MEQNKDKRKKRRCSEHGGGLKVGYNMVCSGVYRAEHAVKMSSIQGWTKLQKWYNMIHPESNTNIW